MKKILVLGRPGSGKTTFADALGKKLNLPVYHLDAFYWNEYWQEKPHQEYLNASYALADKKEWIIEGNATKTLNYRLQKADLVVYLDFPLWLCFKQAIKRQWYYYGKDLPDMPKGCASYFDLHFVRFLYRNVWGFTKKRPSIENELYNATHIPIYRFKSHAESKLFLDTLK
jgi:adenylate kinase family enzyme